MVTATFPLQSKEFEGLGSWVQRQRAGKKGKSRYSISQDRIDRLEEIGFIWDPRDEAIGTKSMKS